MLPVVTGLALAVACDGHNPFYSQLRVGKGGRTFRMWKIRSMVPDADARMQALLSSDPALRKEWETTQKLKSDPQRHAHGPGAAQVIAG